MTIKPTLPHPRRSGWLILVALLHLGGLWLLLHARSPKRPAAPTPPRVAVRLLAGATAADRSEAEAPPSRPPPRPAPPREARVPQPARPAAAPAPTVPQAITLPAPAPARNADAGPPSNTAEAPPAPGDRPLDLALPRAAMPAASRPRSPAAMAAEDARSNSGRASFGATLARELGTDQRVSDELRGDGRVRIRRGADCVDLRDARSADIDPFSRTTRPPPKVGEACR